MSDAPDNPWTTLSTRVVYENPWIRLREDQVLRPDGQPGIYSVVETRLACGVVAVTPAREIYLVGQWRYPLGRYSWEIIEGGADVGEDGEAAIRRELQEEAGLLAKTWTVLGPDIHLSNSYTDEVARLWLAEGLTEVEARPEGTEDITVRKVPLAEAAAMVGRGEVTDAMSVIGILRAQARLTSGADRQR